MKAPFIWFGGKRRVADIVWRALGDVDNYAEPFAGSLAVLLERPDSHRGRTETVNDADSYIANFWRALQADPDEVAYWADWPVNETDLFARHLWLVNEGLAEMKAGLDADPHWYSAKIAGWWVWGLNSWIGSGWCAGKGPWKVVDGRAQLTDGKGGQWRQRPHLGSAGQGVNGGGDFTKGGSGAPDNVWDTSLIADGERPLYGYMRALAARLRDVRVCCGDWRRVVTPGALAHGATVGVFLDPPYSDVRTADLYAVDDLSIAHEVAEWCRQNQDNPRYRIVLAGYEGEHDLPGWEVHAYSGTAAYQTAAGGGVNAENRHKERLWFSPGCIRSRDRQEVLPLARFALPDALTETGAGPSWTSGGGCPREIGTALLADPVLDGELA